MKTWLPFFIMVSSIIMAYLYGMVAAFGDLRQTRYYNRLAAYMLAVWLVFFVITIVQASPSGV